MAVFSAVKVVSALPGTLAANTLYFVRIGTGFRPYVTNSTPTIVAYPLDPITWSELASVPAAIAALAALTSAADKLPYFTGSGTADVATLTAAARALLDDPDTTAMLQTLGSAWKKIGEVTPSSVAAVTFTNLSGYRQLRCRGRLLPATTNAILGLRLSTNNGSSYDSTSGRYTWRYNYAAESLTGQVDSGTDSTRFYFFSSTHSTDGCWFNFDLYDFNVGLTCPINWQFNGRRQGTSNAQQGTGGGWYNQTTARDAFQLAFSSGNVASGHVLLEGLV